MLASACVPLSLQAPFSAPTIEPRDDRPIHGRPHLLTTPPISSTLQLLCDQLEFANVIVLNKLDLVNQMELLTVEALVRKLNPSADLLRTTRGELSPDLLLNHARFKLEQAEEHPQWLVEAREHEHTPETVEYGISSFIFRAKRPFHPERLHAALGRRPRPGALSRLLRLKGIAWLATRRHEQTVAALAGTQFSLSPGEPWDGAPWDGAGGESHTAGQAPGGADSSRDASGGLQTLLGTTLLGTTLSGTTPSGTTRSGTKRSGTKRSGTTLLDGHGSEHVALSGALRRAPLVALYFSAHWCGPCRKFTPKLVAFVETLAKQGTHLPVILCSSDSDEVKTASTLASPHDPPPRRFPPSIRRPPPSPRPSPGPSIDPSLVYPL